MTPTEELEEWRYVFRERMGHLCGDAEKPPPEAVAMAKADADTHVRELKTKGE